MTGTGKTSMRLLCLVLSVVCLLSAVPTVQAAELDIADDRAYTYTTAVHSYASFSSTVIGQMENGTSVTILDQTREFYKIDCYDMVGYVAKYQVALRKDGTHYISCYLPSNETQVLYYNTIADAMALRHSLLALGKRFMGVPYVYGGMSPRGFDCSGFTKYIYGKHDLPLTRRASTQLGDGVVVSRENLQVGDLIFLKYAYESCEASHVGIYAGNNMVLHASSSRGISLASLDSSFFASNYLCARRVINTEAATAETVPAAPSVMSRTRTVGLRSIN